MIILPKENGDIKGIIRSKKQIRVKAYAEYMHGRLPENIFNDELGSKCWYGLTKDGMNITLTFTNVKIILSNYSIQSASINCSNYFPRSWVVHGYHDGKWNLLSNITNSGLSGHTQIKTYSAESLMNAYNTFRFTNTGRCYTSQGWAGNGFIFQALDLFGVIIKKEVTCISKIHSPSYVYLFILLLLK